MESYKTNYFNIIWTKPDELIKLYEDDYDKDDEDFITQFKP